MSKEMEGTKDWFPRLEEYSPNITKDEWCSFVQDKTVFGENALTTFACILKAGVATCADMAEQFGRNANFYNNAVWQTGKKIHEKTNCSLSERSEGGNQFWSVCCQAKYRNGRYEFKIRPELREAFEETKVLEGVEVMEKENISEMGKFKHLLEYFVAHLEYLQNNEDTNARGYKEYIKHFVDGGKFRKSGYGYKGENIQKQIQEWADYGENSICISIYSANYQATSNYLHWINTWFNIKAAWKAGHIVALFLTSEEEPNAAPEMKKTIEDLDLFNGDFANFSSDFKDFYNKFMSYKNPQGTAIMTTDNPLATNLATLLTHTRNIIFHGAPGTGKTFLAKQIAAEMNAETAFVQFHPSYDYTDFVEGLRPTSPNENGQIGFERKDGVFKEFCKRALKNLQDSQKSVEQIGKEKSIDEKIYDFIDEAIENQIKYETIGTKNEFHITEANENTISISIPNNPTVKNLALSKKQLEELLQSEKKFEKVSDITKFFNKTNATQHFSYLLVLCKKIQEKKSEKSGEPVSKIEKKPFVFIIDEINRGDLSKIFGELFYSIEPGYRGKKGSIQTQYQNLIEEGDVFREGFFIPENVYIIGTMNDIDRSVETMDFAFRRRFTFVEIKANENTEMLNAIQDDSVRTTALEKMSTLNNAISEIEGFSSAYHIGGAYFLKLNELGGDFKKLWKYHLEPLLKEYLRGTGNEEKLEELKAAYGWKDVNSGEEAEATESDQAESEE